jgi:chaperone required for assembly of F1-ATPase
VAKGFKEPVEKIRRFYKSVEVGEAEGGFAVLLDGRQARTPSRAIVLLPTRALAELVAADWAAQDEHIELATMHAMRLASTAIDAIRSSREATADQVASYAGSDLLCYFAEGPEALVQRQRDAWDPVLHRAEDELALPFVRASGIIHQAQPEETLASVKRLALELDDFSLAGVAFGTALFGSAILALALQRGWIDADQAFALSRVDETFQNEQWGVDEEAAERALGLSLEAQMLGRWFAALR